MEERETTVPRISRDDAPAAAPATGDMGRDGAGASAREAEAVALPAGMRDPKAFAPSPYRAAWWLPGPHGQTVAGRYLRRPRDVEIRRERVDTPDGDFLDLEWVRVPSARVADDAPLALVIHGLEGSGRSTYVLETCRALARAGIRSVALNFRSCSGEMNRALRFYHAGETGDVAFLAGRLAEREGRPIGAVGYSLGGNILLKHLGEQGDAARGTIAAAVAVSVPFDLAAGSEKLESSLMGRLYTRIFVRSLQAKFAAKAERLAGLCDAGAVRRARSFREFDDAGTARVHGFRDVDHYYADSSSGPFLARVRVPTLIVHAEDDPFVDARSMPRAAVAANPWLAAAFTRDGGHVGFLGGAPWAPTFWAEGEAARFLAPYLHRGLAAAGAAG
jgi:predicted alpha/beta-fold hydrolase